MSSIVSIATPHRPTSPTDSGSLLSRPISVGRSKAVDNPVLARAFDSALPDFAFSRRYLKRRLVSSAEPNPANWRIVQSRERYIVRWMPRVNGKTPGSPIRACVDVGSFSSVVGTASGP
jgi:hypothetical protein